MSGRSRRSRTWLQGSRTARPWNGWVLGFAIAGLTLGLLGAYTLPSAIGGETGSVVGLLCVWTGLAVPSVVAISRSRPRGLFTFSPADLLFGAVLGIALRVAQGWIQLAAGDSGALPALPRVGDQLPGLWPVTTIIGPVLVSPLLEEMLLRGVILVSLVVVLRRRFGLPAAAFVAWVATTALFALAHVGGATADLSSSSASLLLGGVCGALVLATGRIWGAVITHVVFNALYAGLIVVGTFA